MGVEIREYMGGFSTKKRCKTDSRIMHKSGRFTGFSGTGNQQSEAFTAVFSQHETTRQYPNRSWIQSVLSRLSVFPGVSSQY